MFDDPKTPSQKEPEDIFGDGEKTPPSNLPTAPTPSPGKPPVGTPAKTMAPPEKIPSPVEEEPTGDLVRLEGPKKSLKRFLWFILIPVVLILGFVGWLVIRNNFLETAPAEEGAPEKKEAEKLEEILPPISETPAPATEIIPSADSDGDGLTDQEELMLGTDALLPDSDADGLPDRDEVKVYKTDPLDSDTDKDGYFDGEEVQNGFDPKGKGKLYEVPAP